EQPPFGGSAGEGKGLHVMAPVSFRTRAPTRRLRAVAVDADMLSLAASLAQWRRPTTWATVCRQQRLPEGRQRRRERRPPEQAASGTAERALGAYTMMAARATARATATIGATRPKLGGFPSRRPSIRQVASGSGFPVPSSRGTNSHRIG